MTKALRDLNLSDGYRSGQESMLENLYLPCLQVSERYDRSVGFFSSSALRLALAGITNLVKRGGKIRIVASPHLSDADLEQITAGYGARSIDDFIVEATSDLVRELSRPQVRLLASLITNGSLDIKIAIIKNGSAHAIYHEKRGIFRDEFENVVTFVGSANETASALLAHFESVEVFRSWDVGEERRTRRHVAEFERLWESKEDLLKVTRFPDAARDVIVNSAALAAADEPIDPKAFDEAFDRPVVSYLRQATSIRLHEYQRDAIRAWFKNEGRGLLRMATGTGKTITALAAADLVSEDYRSRAVPLTIVVVVPFKDLVLQWSATARQFGFEPILCFHSRQSWAPRFEVQAAAQREGSVSAPLFVIVTNATYVGEHFQRLLTRVAGELFLIVDEVHNIGSDRARALLNDHAVLRLGLSATPERWFDDIGTDVIFDYFGGVVFELGLREAIDRGALTPYRYYVHPVALTEEETILYLDLSERIRRVGGYANIDGIELADRQLKRLLIARARVVGNARQKIPLLEELVRYDDPRRHTLIYCGTGTIGDETSEASRTVDHVAERVRATGAAVAPYTSRTTREARALLQDEFASGRVQYLAAIRCLDEGIDIPATRRAYFLASSSNPRQFIQRRGRVLRRFEGKDRAEIHDMLTLLDAGAPGVTGAFEESVARKEMDRIKAFAEIAENGPQVIATLVDLVPGGAAVVL